MALSNFACLSATGALFLCLAMNAKIASATPRQTLHDIMLPSPNVTSGPLGEIQCYALPYGAIGIISHLLTYWTIAWMAVGKIPLWPWHSLTTYRFDAFLACVALCTCIPIASITMHRCRLSWHFLLICIWKLVTSVSLACITLHRCFITRRVSQDEHHHEDRVPLREHINQGFPYDPHTYYAAPHRGSAQDRLYRQGHNPSFFQAGAQPQQSQKDLTPLWWLTLYLAGTIVGMIGLCSLLYTTFRHDQTIRNLTYGFGAAMAIIPILVAIYWYMQHLDRPGDGHRVCMSAFWHALGGAVLAFTAVFGFFSALYSDLVLGSIANNLFGLPSEDFAPLFWAWFVAKRLPMLSF